MREESKKTGISPRCVVVGDSTLPQACAEILLESGYVICAVVSRDGRMEKWAGEHGIPCLRAAADLLDHLEGQSFDYLFSIVNPHILDAATLAAPRKAAINYHDAPLPRYAGTHATSWALMNRETEYAVTWHRMTLQVDAGDIVHQKSVAIEADDNAMSLNVKCYAAAIDAFREMISDLESALANALPQDASGRIFFANDRRPPAGGCLLWDSSAEDLSALARALQFAPYANPLGLPKIAIGGQFVAVTNVRVLTVRSGDTPGTLVRFESDALVVATATNDVAIAGFLKIDGQPLPTSALIDMFGLTPGGRLSILDERTANRLTEACSRVSRHEKFWMGRLRQMQSPVLPFGMPDSDLVAHHPTQYEAYRMSISADMIRDGKRPAQSCAHTLLAAFAIYLSRIARLDAFDLGLTGRTLHSDLGGFDNFFADVVPLRIDIDQRLGFADNLASVSASLAGVNERGTYARDLVHRYPELRNATFSAMNSWPVAVHIASDVDIADESGGHEAREGTIATSSCMLTLKIFPDGMHCLWIYDTAILNARQIEAMAGQFGVLLKNIAAYPEQPVAELSLLTVAERHRMLVEWNATSIAYPKATAHELFEAQVANAPGNTALVHGDCQLSYAELNAAANRVAHHLMEHGVGPDVLVGLCVERSFDMVIALLGIMKAGGAYVPLDPAYPQERLAYMIEDAGPAMLLTQTHLLRTLPPESASIPTLCLDACAGLLERHAESNPRVALHPAHLAYVIYTSGSTGRPKGVLLHHGGLVNLVCSQIETFGIEDRHRILQFASFNFDASVSEIFMALCCGAALCLASREDLMPGIHLETTLRRSAVSVVTLPPVALGLLSPDMLPKLETVISAGEVCSHAIVERWAGSRRLFNAYGPTEATVCASVHFCLAEQAGSPPIGRPIANTRIYILDRHLNPVPAGVAGELHISSEGLARGYLNRPELTAEKFIPDPFSRKQGDRMYKTGDLARYSVDGGIEYLGRIDDQVKIRGFRIELGEIEAAISEITQIRATVAMVREDSPGDQRLTAYVVGRQGEAVPEPARLRAMLLKKLPEHMVPSAFVALGALPLTPNGKIDRRALPAPDPAAFRERYAAPRTGIEEKLAQLWSDLLGMEKVGVHDNFFDMGGHSLLAAMLMAKISAAFGVHLPLRALFEAPVLEALAQRVGEAQASSPERQGAAAGGEGASGRSKGDHGWMWIDSNLSTMTNRRRNGPAVFLIPGAGGSASIYHGIARKLVSRGADVLLGHHDGIDNDNEPCDSIAAMAERYARQLLRHGGANALVVGYCVGGIIGQEMARIIRAGGGQPSGLFFIDTFIPAHKPFPAFDPEYAKCEFFKAICDTCSTDGKRHDAREFAGLAESACIDRAAFSMNLAGGAEATLWKRMLRRRFHAEIAHMKATHDYWLAYPGHGEAPEFIERLSAASCPLHVMELDGEGESWTAHAGVSGLGVTRETVKGGHITILKDHEDRIVESALAHWERCHGGFALEDAG